MATRLRLRFQGQRSALLLRAVVFFVTLWFAASGGARAVPILFFVLASLWAYATSFENVKPYRASFIALVAASAVAAMGGTPAAWFLLPAALVAYAIFGLKARYFVYRTRIHYVVTLALTYGSLFLFLSSDRSQWFMVKLALAGGVLFFLWKEFFSAALENRIVGQDYRTGERPPRYEAILGALLALATTEVAWAASLLPMSGMNAANLSFLAAFVIGDVIQKKVEGTFSRNAMLVGVTVAVFGTIFILATSSW